MLMVWVDLWHVVKNLVEFGAMCVYMYASFLRLCFLWLYGNSIVLSSGNRGPWVACWMGRWSTLLGWGRRQTPWGDAWMSWRRDTQPRCRLWAGGCHWWWLFPMAGSHGSVGFLSLCYNKSADVTKCFYKTQPKTPNSKQCRCRSTVARKNSIERQEHRKKYTEEPGSEGWPVPFWLCRVEIIRVHGHLGQIVLQHNN